MLWLGAVCVALASTTFVPTVTAIGRLSQEDPQTETSEAAAASSESDDDEEKAPSEETGLSEGEAAAETDTEAEEQESEEQADRKPLSIRCYFVAEKEARVQLRPLEWTAFPILSIVPHGAQVKRGDTLISIDTRKLDAAIEDLENDIAQTRIALEQAEQKLVVSRKADRMSLEAAERAERIAAEDLKRFITQGRSERVEALEQSLRSAENRLAYAQEEYNQLKRMYEADDLTEDTEEIILRRTRDSVENAEFTVDRYRKSQDRGLDVEIPRSEESLEEALRNATLALERARLSLPAKAEQEELALEKQRLELERKERRLERLQADRTLMNITAPMAGLVYYGEHKQGKWADANQMAAILHPGLSAKVNQTLLTIVQVDSLHLKGTISEADLRVIEVGASAVAKPTAFEGMELEATVDTISRVPISDGKFTLEASLKELPSDVAINPGMTCMLEFAPKATGD